MVAGGHLTDPPVENDYSGVVSLDSTPHSIAYPPGLNPFDEEDVQPNLVNINTSRINLCETYVQRLCDNFANQTESSLSDSARKVDWVAANNALTLIVCPLLPPVRTELSRLSS